MIKLNLLPPEEKEAIAINRINSQLLIIGSWLVTILIIFSFVLLLINVYINQKITVAEAGLVVAQDKLKLEGFGELQKLVNTVNKQIIELAELRNKQKVYYPLFKKLVDVLPEGVRFKTVTLDKNRLTIDGFAVSREQVLAIKRELEIANEFEKVSSPISNLIKAKDIDFNFSFQIKDGVFIDTNR